MNMKDLGIINAEFKRYLSDKCDEKGLHPIVRDYVISESQVSLSDGTLKNNLTKRAKERCSGILLEHSELSDKVNERISALPQLSENFNLDPPITPDDVSYFLCVEDDGIYDELILKHINDRLDEEAVEDADDFGQYERPMVQTEDGSIPVGDNVPVGLDYGIPEGFEEPEYHEPQPVVWEVVATFKLEVPEQISKEQIRGRFKEKLDGAGFKTLKNIGVQRV